MGNELALGSVKIDATLDDDELFRPGRKVPAIGVPRNGGSDEEKLTKIVLDSSPSTDGSNQTGYTDEVTESEPSGTVTEDGKIVSYQYWSTAELMSYNMEIALKARWQSIGARGIIDGLSMANSVVQIVKGSAHLLGPLFGQFPEGESTGYQDTTPTGSSNGSGTTATPGGQAGKGGVAPTSVSLSQILTYRQALNGRALNPDSGGFYNQRETHKHAGLDISGPTQAGWGTTGKDGPAFAVVDGTIEKTEPNGTTARGRSVYIRSADGKLRFSYFHLDSVSVSVGDTVKAGQVVGIIGDTGRSSAVHLHFEIRPYSNLTTAYDPIPWLRDGSLVDNRPV